MRILENERVAFAGATGHGKTVAAGALLSGVSRLIVLDPKGKLRGKWGLTEWSSREARALARGEPVRTRVAYPFGGDWTPYLKAVWEAGNCLLYIDEMYGVCPPRKAPPDELVAIYTRGRELGIGCWAAFQRPSWVPMVALTEAEWILCFRLKRPGDMKTVEGYINTYPVVPPKDKYGFYLYYESWDKPVYYPRMEIVGAARKGILS